MRYLKYSLLIVVLCGCMKQDIPVCSDEQGLSEVAHYPIGVAIDYGQLQANPQYKTIAGRQFSSITPENAFKEQYLWSDTDTYAWQQADKIADFCISNGKRLH